MKTQKKIVGVRSFYDFTICQEMIIVVYNGAVSTIEMSERAGDQAHEGNDLRGDHTWASSGYIFLVRQSQRPWIIILWHLWNACQSRVSQVPRIVRPMRNTGYRNKVKPGWLSRCTGGELEESVRIPSGTREFSFLRASRSALAPTKRHISWIECGSSWSKAVRVWSCSLTSTPWRGEE